MRRFLIATILLTAATPAALAQSAPTVLSCEGVFDKTSDHARLVKVFGAGAVAYTKIAGAEGMDQLASVVNPKDSARRLEFVWMNEKARKEPHVLVRDRSRWKTPDGIGIGSSLADVEKLNGKPFELSGFDWDYGGVVTDLKGGALASRKGGCVLGLRFGADLNAPEKARSAVSGDKTIASSNPDMRAARPTVTEISIGWRR